MELEFTARQILSDSNENFFIKVQISLIVHMRFTRSRGQQKQKNKKQFFKP